MPSDRDDDDDVVVVVVVETSDSYRSDASLGRAHGRRRRQSAVNSVEE